jgi:hypothetical protein
LRPKQAWSERLASVGIRVRRTRAAARDAAASAGKMPALHIPACLLDRADQSDIDWSLDADLWEVVLSASIPMKMKLEAKIAVSPNP